MSHTAGLRRSHLTYGKKADNAKIYDEIVNTKHKNLLFEPNNKML